MENIKKGKIDIDRYRVKANEKVKLKKFPTKRDVDIDKGEVKNAFFPEVIENKKTKTHGPLSSEHVISLHN